MTSFEHEDKRRLQEESLLNALTVCGGLQALGVTCDPDSVAQGDAAPFDPVAAIAYGTIRGGRFMAGATNGATDQALRSMTSWPY